MTGPQPRCWRVANRFVTHRAVSSSSTTGIIWDRSSRSRMRAVRSCAKRTSRLVIRTATVGTHSDLRGWIGEREEETELVYLNARYYDPEIARFISPDPLADLGQRLNRYLRQERSRESFRPERPARCRRRRWGVLPRTLGRGRYDKIRNVYGDQPHVRVSVTATDWTIPWMTQSRAEVFILEQLNAEVEAGMWSAVENTNARVMGTCAVFQVGCVSDDDNAVTTATTEEKNTPVITDNSDPADTGCTCANGCKTNCPGNRAGGPSAALVTSTSLATGGSTIGYQKHLSRQYADVVGNRFTTPREPDGDLRRPNANAQLTEIARNQQFAKSLAKMVVRCGYRRRHC